MSSIYDNWESLVHATLDREKLRELARLPSIATSSNSSISSDFNISPYNSQFISVLDYVPGSLMDRVIKAAENTVSFKRECFEIKSKAEDLAGMFRQAASESDDLSDRHTHRIVSDTELVLEKALKLVTKCRHRGIKRFFNTIPAKAFQKMFSLLESSIEDVSWLISISDAELRLPPAALVPIPLRTTYQFQSRKQIEEEIMEALKANEIRIVGICGMGGVGKTTMAKRIMNKVRDENIFQEIPMAVVSQQVDMLKIQDEIAESLGLKLEEKTLAARANKLRARLTGADTKRILVVLDDVWETLKLDELGIPCGNEWCTILFTSRNRDVLRKMDAEKICGVEVLSNDEAWDLFRDKAGICEDDNNLCSIAQSVVEECKGLPIALITVGGALKNIKIISFWEHALDQLKNFNPIDMPDVIKDVYNPLKLSYTSLENRDARSLFLLCSLFPEDDDISLEELVSYCRLGMFCNLDVSNKFGGSLEKVRKRVFTAVDMLKESFLLLEGSDAGHMRMHDVVRDVANYIAKNEAKTGEVDVKFNLLRSSREFTLQRVSVLSEKISNLLWMHAREERFEIKDFSLFNKEMEELNVLSFKNISLKSLPMATQLLKNLRTLRLESCNLVELEPLSVVGELLSLEILCCRDCSGIQELSVEIGKLNQLKLLDFSHCRSLERIPPGVISNLVKLEEFKMLFSFGGWESTTAVRGQEGRNASLNEFENLSNLICLEIQINDSNLAAEEIRFSPKIVKYDIRIGFMRIPPYELSLDMRSMVMKLGREIKLGSWVLRFLRSSNYLALDLPYSLDLPQVHNMKSLRFENWSTVKRLVNTTSSIDDLSKFDVFPILESLSLSNLPNLEEILDGEVLDSSNSFNNLRELRLEDMPALKHLCKRPDWSPVSLDNIERIKIRKCSNVVNLFSFTMDAQSPNASVGIGYVDDLLCIQKVYYPKLQYLTLQELDKLEVIWSTSIPEGSYSFSNLKGLQLYYLPAMIQLWKNPSKNFSLSNLTEIDVRECHKLRSLFSSTMSMDFVLKLERLEIKRCKMMNQVMLLNEENITDSNQCCTIQFPKLSNLTLHSLESLTTFSKGIESVEFPVLVHMSIKKCPKFMSHLFPTGNNQDSTEGHDNHTYHLFCSEKVSFGSLKEIHIEKDNKSNIWCRQIPLDFFRQLEKLKFTDCSIRSLFSSSITENLVNLKSLSISNCKEMIKVIEDNEEMWCEKSLVLFPSLKELLFWNLPKLKSVCNWRCNLQLPSLEEVDIEECPLLEFFSMGSVTTPNLKRYNWNEGILGDLNSEIKLCIDVEHQRSKQIEAEHQLSSIEEESTSSETSMVEANSEESEIKEENDDH